MFRYTKEDAFHKYEMICVMLGHLVKSNLPAPSEWYMVKYSMYISCISNDLLEYNSEKSYCSEKEEVHYFEHYSAKINLGIAVVFEYDNEEHPFHINFYAEYANAQISFRIGESSISRGYVFYQTIGELTYLLSFNEISIYYKILNGEREISDGSAELPLINTLGDLKWPPE